MTTSFHDDNVDSEEYGKMSGEHDDDEYDGDNEDDGEILVEETPVQIV
jgi:hypothetical protein